MLSLIHPVIEPVSVVLELLGAGVIVGSVVIAGGAFVTAGLRPGGWRTAYGPFRAKLGRGILLGLELLVAADIIATITAPLTLETVGLLGLVVLIRTFLTFSVETEIEGCWPWRRAQMRRDNKA